MSLKAMLDEMLALLQEQVEAVIAGDAERLALGTARHEELLSLLPGAEQDLTADQLQEHHQRLEVQRAKLVSLLMAESTRTDFMMRLLLGGKSSAVGYPESWHQTGVARPGARRA
jgi:hypothetical protein